MPSCLPVALQEQHFLRAVVDRVTSFQPDVLLVEKSVSRHAQELLLDAGVSLVLNVKRELLERVAECTGAEVRNLPGQLLVVQECMQRARS